ncbi:MAG: glycoside hydrolase family 15 protein [Actinomycetota bacterium]|nr:glycoside hydrolase family 15 protein [Actinomycetota bacterium]
MVKPLPRLPPATIEEHAMIGDTRTAALIDRHGSVDWLCAPRFDSDPVFNRLLARDGTAFDLYVEKAQPPRRRYEGATLVTQWSTPAGDLEVRDCMPTDVKPHLLPTSLLVRHMTCTRGRVEVTVRLDVTRGFEETPTKQTFYRAGSIYEIGNLALGLTSDLDERIELAKPLRFGISQADSKTIALSFNDSQPAVFPAIGASLQLIDEDERAWKRWMSEVEYEGPRADLVQRSLLTLRLLTYSPSGAPVAAPTTSLPGAVGYADGRNWDYRYSWPRDASLGITAFLRSGMPEESRAFLHWLRHAGRVSRPEIKVLYRVDGTNPPKESVVGSGGFAHSAPLLVGNRASDQFQLDAYGWVLGAADRFSDAAGGVDGETLRTVAAAADLVGKRWMQPDSGIWEMRTHPQHHVHSKMMSWVALDSALSLLPDHRHAKAWQMAREALFIDVRSKGIVQGQSYYSRTYGSTQTDAALLSTIIEFEPDPRLRLGTIDAIRRELSAGGPLLKRYRVPDGIESEEGAFVVCTFWLISALAKVGRKQQATDLFDEIASMANDVGLFAEQIEPGTHRFLGNFPQAISHSSLVIAAHDITVAHDE